MAVGLDEHLATLRVQAKFSAIAHRKTADLIERLAASSDKPTAAELDELRKQIGSTLSAGRTTKQLAARAAALIEASTAEGGTADGDSTRRAAQRVSG
jgi:hypothetical protein